MKDDGSVEEQPDAPSDYDLRSEALDAAVRVADFGDSALTVLSNAKAYEAYLRGSAVPAEPKSED